MPHTKLQASREAQTVRVTVPVDVAFDLPRIQEVTAKVLGILGCENCHSGYDIRYDLESRFVVDQELNVRGFPGF